MRMLAVTQDAALVIRGIVDAAELPEEAGLRITVEETAEGRVGLGLDLAAEPQADDEVVDALGAQIFLEPDAAELLDDKVLDATLVDDRIAFAIGEVDASSDSAGPGGPG
jgi:iron-sulfur cluster assembly protein